MDVTPLETVYNGYRFRGKELPIMPKKVTSRGADLLGKRFGRGVVTEFLGNEKHGYKWWGLNCDCRTKFAARSRELKRGHTKSCGCLRKENASVQGGHNKLPAGQASRNELLASYKKSARDRKIEWLISDNLFFWFTSSNCYYCDSPPDTYRKPNKGVNGGVYYSGIDRIDCSFGYMIGNIVPCCWNCNRAKGVMPYDEFIAWVAAIAARQARFEFGQVGAPKNWRE